MKKYLFVCGLLLSILILSLGITAVYVNQTKEKEEDFTIVTSFYPMYIAAQNITDGVEGVHLLSLSEPQTGCLHDFQLTPEDMKQLSTADVFVVNGAGVESFLEEVAQAYPKLHMITACEYIELLQDGEEANGHAWMDVSRYQDMVMTIAEGLSEADPAHGRDYKNNASVYGESLALLARQAESLRKNRQGQKVILLHEAFAYLAETLGMQVCYVMDLDEERQISAGEVADVVALIQREQVTALFAEERHGKEMAETLKEETGINIIYLDPLNRGDYEKDSYLKNMEHNLKLLR